MAGGDPRDQVRAHLEAGWRVLVLKEDGEAFALKEASLGPDGAIVEASPGVWAQFAAPDDGSD